MKKNVLLSISLLLLALTFGSCRRMTENAVRKIRIEAVEDFRLRGLSHAEMVLRIANGTRHTINLDQVELTLLYKERPAITLQLREEIQIKKRTTESLATRWKMEIQALTLLLVARDIRNDDPSQMQVSFRIEGHAGFVHIDVAREKMPLSEFLSIFGITWPELKQQIRTHAENILPQ